MTQYSKHLGLNKVRKKNLFSYSDTDLDGTSRSSSASRKGRESFRKGKLDKSVGGRSIRSGKSINSRKSGVKKDGEDGSRDQSPMNRWRDSPWNDRRLRKKKKKLTKKQKEKVAKMGAIYGQDAKTLAGLNNPNRWKNHFGNYDVPLRSPSKRTAIGSRSPSPVKRTHSADLSFRSIKIKPKMRETSPDAESDYRGSKKKTMKFKKRKDRYSFIDYDSPYAEYLPARFREWAPSNID